MPEEKSAEATTTSATNAELEQATPAQGSSEATHAILGEAGVSGGSDNTAIPAGGNPTHDTPKEHRHQVEESPAAQEEYAGTDEVAAEDAEAG